MKSILRRKNKEEIIPFDREKQQAVLKCSICTGEQVAGFKDIESGRFTEVSLIKTQADLDVFMKRYDLTAIKKEY